MNLGPCFGEGIQVEYRADNRKPARNGERFRFSLRSVFVFILVLAMSLSGAFTNPASITLAIIGFAMVCAACYHREKVQLTGILAGLGYICVAAVIGRLLSIQ